MRRALTQLLCRSAALSAQTQLFIRVSAKTAALTHVRVIDGTEAPERANQTILISVGRIQAVGATVTECVPPSRKC